jgi:hypothetical protein
MDRKVRAAPFVFGREAETEQRVGCGKRHDARGEREGGAEYAADELGR